MTILGIEFASNHMNYLVLEQNEHGELAVLGANRITLAETRSPDALRAFQRAVQTLLQDAAPDLLAIKEKPEKGAMQAGAAALKMESIVLANTGCTIQFVSGARINKCQTAFPSSLKVYHQSAFQAAACAAKGR